MLVTIYKVGTNLSCIGQSYSTSSDFSDFTYDVYANNIVQVQKTWTVTVPGCNPTSNFTLKTLDASGNWVTEAFSWASFTTTSTSATFQVLQSSQSALYPLFTKQVAFKFTVLPTEFPLKTFEKTWILTLNQGCAANVLSLTTRKADIYYLPLSSPSVQNVGVFAYTSTKTAAQCPLTELKMQVKYKLDADWLDYNSAVDVWVKPSSLVASTLAFDIQASTSQVTYGDQVYVRRFVYDMYSGSSLEDLFTIYWLEATCRTNTLSLQSSDVTSQTAVVGTSMTIISKLSTTACPYTAACQIFDNDKAAWLDAATYNSGITCSATGAWTVNIANTSTAFDPSKVLLAQVIYISTQSIVLTTSDPSRQVIDQFYLTIQSKCLATIISFTDFADITHQLTSGTNSVNYSGPGFTFTGSDNTVCPNTVKFELREDGSAQNWASWSGGSFATKASTPVTYTFVTSLTTTGAMNVLGGFTINTTGRLFTPSKKFNARLTLTGNGSAKVVEVLFNITLVDNCSANTFTISQPATVNYSIALSGTTTAISRTMSTVTGATSGCTLEYTLEVYDSSLFDWVQVTTANVASKWTFLQYTSSTTTNAFSVQTTNFSTWGNTSTQLRQRVKDPNSLQVGGNGTSSLVVNISYVCSSDTLSITTANNIQDQLYLFGTTSQNLSTPVVAQTQTSCPLTCLLQVYDTTKKLWVDYSSGSHSYFVKTFSTITGQIAIENLAGTKSTAGDLLPSVQIGMRIVVTSTSSTSLTLNSVTDEFTLTMQASCADNQLKLDGSLAYSSSGTALSAQDYKIGSTFVAITPLYSTSKDPALCPLTATLYVFNDLTQQWVSQSSGGLAWLNTFKPLVSGGDKAGYLKIFQTDSGFIAEQKWTVKIQITDLKASSPTSILVEDTFTVNVYYKCSRNTLAFNSDQSSVTLSILPGGSTPGVAVANSAVTSLETTCLLIRSLEIYNSVLKTWTTYAAAQSSTYPWITSWTDPVGAAPNYTSSTNGFSVQTNDYATYDTLQPTTYQLRMKVQDPYSVTIYDEFNVTLKFSCDDDVVSLSSDITMQAYQLGSGNKLILKNAAQTVATCPLTAVVQVWDGTTPNAGSNVGSSSQTNSWITVPNASYPYITSVSAGTITVNQAVSATYSPYYDLIVRVTYTSTYSKQTVKSVTDEFTLRLTSSPVCLYNTLTKTSELADVVYTVFSTAASQTVTPLYTTLLATSTCALTAKLYYLNDAANTWTDNAVTPLSFITFNAASTASGAFSIQQTTRATYAPSTKFELKVRIQDLNSNQQVLEFQFSLELRDRCADDTLTLSSQIASYSYQIGSGDSTVNMMKPSFAQLYSSCQLDANLYFLDTKTGLYLNDNTGLITSGSPYEFVKTFTAAGELTINTSNNSKYGLKSDFLVKITLSLPWSSPNKSISYQFTITILNKCQNNSLMFTIANAQSNLKYYIKSDFDGNASNTPDQTLTPVVTSTQTQADCPLQATLEVWNNLKHMYETQAVSGWVKTFNTSTGVLEISTTSFATYHPRTSPTFADAWTTFDVRITLKDPNSSNLSNSASEIFTLQILRECSDVSITKVSNIAAVTYFVGSGLSTAIVPSFTIGQSGCKPDFRLWFFDALSGEWSNTYPPAVSSFDLTTGSLILNTWSYSVYNKPVVYTTKITAFNTVSSISYQFNITVKDQCYDIAVTTPIILKDNTTNNQHTELDPFVWDLWQYTTAKITDPVVSIAGCPTTFTITDIDTERTQIPVSTLKITGTSPNQSLEGVYRDTTKIGARYFYVRATIKNQNNDLVILTTETKYFVNFKNPCTRSSSIIASAIPDIDYWIKDVAATQTLADYNDQASRDYGGITRSDSNFSTAAKLCGSKSYKLYKQDLIQNILVVGSPFISLASVASNQVITVQTNDPKYFTNSFVNYLVKVSMDDYEVSNPKETIWWETVRVQLKNCQVTSMTYPSVGTVDYNLYTPLIYIQMTQFTQVYQAPFSRSSSQQCGYALTYTAKWLDYYGTIIDLPSFITWNAAQFRFEVQSSNLLDLTTIRQTYKLLLIASVDITNMSPVFSETQQITLNVNNGCLLDTSTTINSISDYIYYINENTEFGTWTQNALPKPQVRTFTTIYTQSVAGCPVDYKIYRTYADGSRKLITAYEQSVLSFTYPTINVATLWASQSSLLPFTVVVTLTTANYNYDLQEWNLNVAQASTYSTAASREATTNFKLTLKDVCWDLPLSGITIASVPVSEDIYEVFKLSYTTLNTQWGDYCGGFSYNMQYVSGPKVQGTITAALVDLMLVYSSVTSNNSALLGVPYMTATINDRSWIGDHIVKIVGQNGIAKKYKTYTTADFTLKIVDPCERSVVSAQVITDMVFTIGPNQVSTKQYYNEFGDSMGLIYGSQYSKCGPRLHLLTQVGSPTPMQPFGSQILQFLGFESYPNGNPTLAFPSTPNAFGIFVNTDNTDYVGERQMKLTVSLLNYPGATSAVVNFKIRIDPCVVTSYAAPMAMTISFAIGQTPMNAIFNFVQGSCAYPATYRAQLQSGAALPTFFTQNSRSNYFNVRATNLANVGQYVVEIKATLDNILVQSTTLNTYLLPAQSVIASSPPVGYIYTNSFLLTINIYASGPGVQTNQNPFFSPLPYDTWVYVGDRFTQTYGKALDTANSVINVTVDLGDAARFLSFDFQTNSISIAALKTTAADIRSYKLRITLATTQLIPVVTTYDFVLAIKEKPNNLSQNQVLTDQRLTEVFNKYDNKVIDLRGVASSEIYSNQYSSQYLPTLQTTVMPVGGSSQQFRLTTYTAVKPDITTKTPPIPFVKNISPDGVLTIGFDQLMNVPPNLLELLKKQVAIRWMQAKKETYLTPEGYRDFEIRPSLDIQVIPSPNSDPIKLDFNFDLVSFDNNELKVKLNFQLPEYVSSQGISKDQVLVTFWDNKSLTAVNGLPVPEGTTLSKPVTRLIIDQLVTTIDKISKRCAISAVIIIVVGLLISLLFDLDEAPFWSLFNTWQIISHLSLLNLNYSGFFTQFLRTQLDFMLLRIPSWQRLVYKTSKISIIDERSFSDAFETSGYPSMLLTINLSMPLAVIGVLLACLPLAWLIDKIVSVPDPQSKFGGRKQIFKKPLFSKTVNAILRCLMIVFLDLSICMLLNIFSWKQNYKVNAFGKINACVVISSSCVIGLLFAFVWAQAIIHEVQKKKIKDVKIIGEYSTIYIGLNSYQPIRASTFNAVFCIRRFIFATAVVFLQEAPVTQILILVLGSLFTMVCYGQFRPFNENYNAWLEYLNEWCIMLTTMMCITFTDLVPEVENKNKVAWLLIIFFLFILIKNICFGFYSFWYIYHRRMLGFDNKVAVEIVKDIKVAKAEVKMQINGNDRPLDEEVGEVKDPYHNPYSQFQVHARVLGQNTCNVQSDGPSGWMSAHNDNEKSSFQNQPKLLRPLDNTTELDASGQQQMSVYDMYKVHTGTLRSLMTPTDQEVDLTSFRQSLPNQNLQIEEEHWNNDDFNIRIKDQQSEEDEADKVGQLHEMYSDKFVGTNKIQTRNAVHRKGFSEDLGSFSKSGKSNGSFLIDQQSRNNLQINRQVNQLNYNQQHQDSEVQFTKKPPFCRDMSNEKTKNLKSALHIFENPLRNSIETSSAVNPKSNLQFYGRQNIDQISASNASIYQDPQKIASMTRHRKIASFSDLIQPSARVKNAIVMSRFERRQRNIVQGEQRKSTGSPPNVVKTYESDDEDFKKFEQGLAKRTDNVRKSPQPQRIKDKVVPKLSNRNIKLEHDILSMASSELSRLGKK